MHEKSLRSPQDTLQSMYNLKIFWGRAPDPLSQSILWGPTFCICPGPPQSSQWPWWFMYTILVHILVCACVCKYAYAVCVRMCVCVCVCVCV